MLYTIDRADFYVLIYNVTQKSNELSKFIVNILLARKFSQKNTFSITTEIKV